MEVHEGALSLYRVTLVARLAALIDQLRVGQRVLVSFDGPDAAGKTSLANLVAARLARPATRVSVDGWHNPREVRLRRGNASAEGYYRDSFDYDALVHDCLEPFAAGADLIRTARFDYRTDGAVEAHQNIAPNAALLVDGVFLLRPELRGRWDLRVYLDVPESVTLARAMERDQVVLGDKESVRRRYEQRYLPGQALYREAAAPLEQADIVIDNTHPSRPIVLRWPISE